MPYFLSYVNLHEFKPNQFLTFGRFDMKVFNKVFNLALLSIVAITANAGTYYKWTDGNGVPHYSQYAPINGVDLNKVQVINSRELTPATSAIPAGQATAQAPVSPEQQRIAELEAQQKAQQQLQDQERCKALQNNLANLNTGGRLYEMDSKGERKYLDSREIELKRQEAQKAINQYCK